MNEEVFDCIYNWWTGFAGKETCEAGYLDCKEEDCPMYHKAEEGMVHLCDKPCGNKTESGYCATTACINPQFSNIGTAQYGQVVQKRIVTNADRIRAMSDEELADWLVMNGNGEDYKSWLDWLRQEAQDG